ncbi:MAG TPA: acryloyl-CoA reductase [Pirellulales bacterium]|nr:acryloyl-CoA reductase [Pirellulales bacterium]
MEIPKSMRCLLVTKQNNGAIERRVTTVATSALPAGDVLLQVQFSSLNFKDALAASGHSGVVSRFPHVPGIDAAGTVVESSSPKFRTGDKVIATSFELGAARWGAYAELIRVPADWVVPLPATLTMKESMILGTAGITAALCVEAIQRQGIESTSGNVVVTGASGGVGTLAVAMLAQAGFRVSAVTGKPAAADLLRRLGAQEILSREAVTDASGQPLLKARWAAAVDTVGGTVLSTLLRTTNERGCVTACGLVGGVDLPITVYPFILRGVVLAGIDSASYPADKRPALWAKLAGPLKPALLNDLAVEVPLAGLESKIEDILAGRVVGRIVVKI